MRVNIGMPVVWTGGQAVYGHMITKFSGMGRFTYPWCSAGVLHVPELRYDPSHIAYNSSFFELTMSKKQQEVLFSEYMIMRKEEKTSGIFFSYSFFFAFFSSIFRVYLRGLRKLRPSKTKT